VQADPDHSNRGIVYNQFLIKLQGFIVTAPHPAAEDGSALTPTQQALLETWEEHVKHEFATRNVDETMATMVDDPHVNHVPVMTGGVGRDQVREFYATRFIPRMPPDLEINLVSRTVGADRIVDEMVIRFSHTVEMDWMLPGVLPTGRAVEVAVVAIIQFQAGKVAHEHIYWDQASVLAQLGLLDADALPVAGAEAARKVLDPSLPSNALIERAERGEA
jgi:carboxymethylenebutenolidase